MVTNRSSVMFRYYAAATWGLWSSSCLDPNAKQVLARLEARAPVTHLAEKRTDFLWIFMSLFDSFTITLYFLWLVSRHKLELYKIDHLHTDQSLQRLKLVFVEPLLSGYLLHLSHDGPIVKFPKIAVKIRDERGKAHLPVCQFWISEGRSGLGHRLGRPSSRLNVEDPF